MNKGYSESYQDDCVKVRLPAPDLITAKKLVEIPRMQQFEAMEIALENGIESVRAQVLTGSVYRLVIRVMRENNWCARTGSGALNGLIAGALEDRGLTPVLSEREEMVSEYLFHKLTQTGWHGIAKDQKVKLEPNFG